MVLSNAERQRRYLARLKEAAKGVTPDDIRQAARLIFEKGAMQDTALHRGQPDTWEAFVGRCQKSRSHLWRESLFANLSNDPDDYNSQFTPQEVALLVKVSAVVGAIAKPPANFSNEKP